MRKRFTQKKLIGMGVIVFIIVAALMWVSNKISGALQLM